MAAKGLYTIYSFSIRYWLSSPNLEKILIVMELDRTGEVVQRMGGVTESRVSTAWWESFCNPLLSWLFTKTPVSNTILS